MSTPGSAEYQQFLTPEEIADIVRSDEADMLAVKEWLVSAEGASCTVHADAFACKVPRWMVCTPFVLTCFAGPSLDC